MRLRFADVVDELISMMVPQPWALLKIFEMDVPEMNGKGAIEPLGWRGVYDFPKYFSQVFFPSIFPKYFSQANHANYVYIPQRNPQHD